MGKHKQKQKQVSSAPTKTELAKRKGIEKLNTKTKAEQKPKMFANSVYRPQPGYPRPETRAPVQQYFPINSPTATVSAQTGGGSEPPRLLVRDTRRDGRPLVKDPNPSPSSRPQNGLIPQKESASPNHAIQGLSLVESNYGSNFRAKGYFPFLELPGELRNKIYHYCIPARSFSITWLKRSKGQPRGLTYRRPTDPQGRGEAPKTKPDIHESRLATRHPNHPNSDVQRRRHVMEAIYSQKRSPIAMLWVCRAMYPEASSAFYGKCSFGFDQLSCLRYFLQNLSVANTRSITTLCIKHHAYGHPYLLANEKWKKKADEAFEELCSQITTSCTSLTHLRLDLNYHRCPIRFGPVAEALYEDFTHQWMVALWVFDQAILESLRLRLYSDVVEDTVLEVASHELRRELLGPRWDEKKQARCDPFGFPLVKKTKVLRIVE